VARRSLTSSAGAVRENFDTSNRSSSTGGLLILLKIPTRIAADIFSKISMGLLLVLARSVKSFQQEHHRVLQIHSAETDSVVDDTLSSINMGGGKLLFR
jgi:hypothetical protein